MIYDPVGGKAFTAATECIAHEGRLLAVGFASGDWARPSTAHLVMHNYSVMGVMPGGYEPTFRREAHAALLDHQRRGEIAVPIHRVVPFDALPEGLEDLARGRVRGKIVLAV